MSEVAAWACLFAGVALVIVAVGDLFLAVLHVEAESTLSNALHRSLWRVLMVVTSPLPGRWRSAVLAWGAPVMILVTVNFWVVLFVVGFALVFTPFIHDEGSFHFVAARATTAFADALYFSSISFLTTGYGDIVPVAPLPRALAVLEGASGLLTISLAVAYLLSVYPVVRSQIALAVLLNQETGGRADGLLIATRFVAHGRSEAVAQRLQGLNAELLQLAQAHAFYPVLYYIRPRNAHQSFVRILAVVQGILATLRYALGADGARDIASDPRLMALEEGFVFTIHSLGASSHLAEIVSAERRAGPRDYAADFAVLCGRLSRRGIEAASPDDEAAQRAYARFRAATDPFINAYGVRIGYDIDAVRSTYSRSERGTALSFTHDEDTPEPPDV